MSYTEINAHRMIARVCEEMAQSIYEECASKYDHWYQLHPDRRAFVRECAPTLRACARQTLAEMLDRNDISDSDKARIYEALMLDKAIPQTGAWRVH